MSKQQRLREKCLQQIRDFRLIDDDFMVRVFSNKACTQLLLDIVLDRKDLTVHTVRTQYEIKNLSGRSVRLDVFATDTTGRAYNIEIQRSDKGAVAQRARYNSSLIDANISIPGEDFANLPETYVIFITEHDVLGGSLPLYHVDRVIRENGKAFCDGTHIVYVNSQIRDDTALGKLMQDFYCTEASDMNYPALAEQVKHYKESEEGVRTMCRSVEKLCEEVRADAIKNAMKNFGVDVNAAMKGLGIAEEDYPKYLRLLSEDNEKTD